MKEKEVTKAMHNLLVDAQYIQQSCSTLGRLPKGTPEREKAVTEFNDHYNDLLQAANTLKSYFTENNA